MVLYLLFPYFEGLNQKLKYHKQGVYGRFATNKVEALKHAKHWDDAQVEQAFHHASEKTSKFLLVVLIPLTALAFWAVSWRRRKYSFDQMVFATEVNCMYLIWGFLLLPLLFYIAEWICVQLTGSGFELGDAITSLVFLLLPMTVFVWVGAQRFYGYGIGKAGLFALYFAFVHTFLVMIAYKFILFVVVINQIH